MLTEDQVAQAQERVAQAEIEAAKQRAVASAHDAVFKFGDQLKQLGKIRNDDLVQAAGEDLFWANVNLKDAMSTNSYDFSRVTIKLAEGQEKMDEFIKTLGDDLTPDVQQLINDAKEALKTIIDVSRETKESIKDTETGEIPEELEI